MKNDRGGTVLLGLLAAVAVLMPILNLAVPESSPLHVSPYVLTLVGKYLCYAMLALAVDLIWGYCGILSLGHAESRSECRMVSRSPRRGRSGGTCRAGGAG